MQSKLNKRTVDAANEPGTVWDTEQTGFGLRVTRRKSDGKIRKTYVLKYRMHSRQRWYTIGRHGKAKSKTETWTAELARTEAKSLLGRIAEGVDPAEELAADRASETLDEFHKRYLTDHAEAHNKASSVKETKRLLKKHIIPKLGHIKVKDLSRSQVVKFHIGLKDTPYEANRALAVISNMLTKAEEWGVRDDGSRLCRTVKKFKETKRERFLSATEASALGDALKAAEKAKTNSHALGIIRLLAFTGARRSEIEGLKWSEVDLERSVLRLDDSKTGAKLIPLAPAAKLILSDAPHIEGSPYVFPAATGEGHYQGLGKVWQAVRKAAGLEDVRLHDLRHTFASFGAAGGLSLPIIGKLLGHSQAATTQRYAHLADDPVARAADQVGNAVAAAMAGGGAEVTDLSKAKGTAS
ncbi:tyrosine-type recombinase/integrase [Maricaulis sp.]|uniref:tyrosine-type recombinase/integrase n=1 Tax=Maricaulis sp. TaxID=1486257 RepID=UPI003A8DCA37